MKFEYISSFAPQIRAMVELRSALGYVPETYQYTLLNFDRFCERTNPSETVLTRELISDWCGCNSSGEDSAMKLKAIRLLGRYLTSIGIEAFVVPANWIPPSKRDLPYIFSDDELTAFFNAADEVAPCKVSPVREYTLPVIYRLMYACGLRPQEARKLKCCEVNLKQGNLYISETKHNKDRQIPMGEDILHLCQKYDAIVELCNPKRNYFFESPSGGVYTSTWLTYCFHQIRRAAGNIAQGSVPYDFRHNFATRTLMRWAEEGADVSAKLPYLSAYMGHAEYSATAYYVHLLPNRLAACDFVRTNGIIPEVAYEN